MKMVEKKDGEQEYGKDGKEEEGGGYLMRKGKLCKMAKSVDPDDSDDTSTGLTEEDLQKGLDALDEYVEGTDSESRKDTLLQKALDSELDGEEQAELFTLMGGVTDDDDDDADESVTKSIKDNPTVSDAFEVSEFLREINSELIKSIGKLEDRIERMDRRQQEFDIVLAKSVSTSGKLTKAMSQRLGVIASQPARGPKSKLTGAQPLHKSVGDAGGDEDEGQMIKSKQVFDALDRIMQKSIDAGRTGVSESGHDLAVAVSKFEHQRVLHPALLEEVKAELGL